MQSVAVGWYLYALTGNPMALAYIGLSVFIPIALFTLPGGDVADRVDRRFILGSAHLVQAVCGALFVSLTLLRTEQTWPFYAVLALSGAARAFSGPAMQSFIPFLVPREQFAPAVAWTSSVSQTATVLGPAAGGLLYLLGPEATFVACLAMSLCVAAAMLGIRVRGGIAGPRSGTPLTRVVEGLRYLRRQRILLGAISLDLLAVFLGSITALLPIYARDILGVGPDGLGVMRSSLALGAVAAGVLLAQFPSQQELHAGRALFAGVAVFGLAALVFGLSTNFFLSLAALVVMGAADMVSVFVRSSVIQLGTPDEMRGRVASVHMLFVGAANELGDFRAGAAAAWLGALPAVLAGGACTLAVVGVWGTLFPELRKVKRLADVRSVLE